MMINEEDWIKGTHSTYGDDPREHDEEETELTEDDIDVDMCISFLEEHGMLEMFYDSVGIIINKYK